MAHPEIVNGVDCRDVVVKDSSLLTESLDCVSIASPRTVGTWARCKTKLIACM